MIRLDLIILLAATVVLTVVTVLSHRSGRAAVARKKAAAEERLPGSGEYVGMIDFWQFGGVMFGGIFAGIAAIMLAVTAFPYSPTYWFYQEHSGEIESISNRFADASGDISTGTYTLTVDGKALVAEDPRVLTYQVGDDIDLNCLPSFVYGAADRLYCNIR